MAITIEWGTRIISVEKVDMNVIQVSPEVRQLDVDVLRLALKALEDDEEGQPHPDTHVHNTEVVISGLTFARTVEIVNGYTVEFEDDYYMVACSGANHNIYDVMVQNKVSINPWLSAGLIRSDAQLSQTDKDEIIAGVWDEPFIDHQDTGSFGEKVGKKLLTLAKFIGLK